MESYVCQLRLFATRGQMVHKLNSRKGGPICKLYKFSTKTCGTMSYYFHQSKVFTRVLLVTAWKGP